MSVNESTILPDILARFDPSFVFSSVFPFPYSLLLGKSFLCFLNGFTILCQELAHKLICHFIESLYNTFFYRFITSNYSLFNLIIPANHFFRNFLICLYQL